MLRFKKLLVILGLAILFLPSLIFFPNYGTGDMDIWLEWTSDVARWGPLNAYSIVNRSEDFWTVVHPPIYFVNFWLATKAAAVFNASSMIGIKIILLLYYLATWASLIYLSTIFRRKRIWDSIALSSGLFLGGLYFVVNSAAFSYMDITFAPFVVFSLALLARRRYLLSGICIAIAVLSKYVVLVTLPAFLFYFVYKKGRRYKIDTQVFKFFGGMFLVFGLLIIVFSLDQISLFSLVSSFRKALNYGAGKWAPGALNFPWFIGYGVVKLIYPETWVQFIRGNVHIFSLISGVIFLSVTLAILSRFIKKKKDIINLLKAGLMFGWSYVIWRTGVQENHIFITVLMALSLAIISTNWSNVRLYLWLCFFSTLNLLVFFGIPVRKGFVGAEILNDFTLMGLLSAFHILIYLVYLRKYLAGSEAS